MNELFNLTQEVQIYKVNLNAFGDISLTPGQMQALLFMIDEEEWCKMAKLYPPTINENIPAFYEENGTVKITVPFSMNRAVLKDDISGFILKIKTVQGNV